MRVLASFVGGWGHFAPTLPVARALAASGHEVAYAAQAALVPSVEACGFRASDTGGNTLLDQRERRALRPVDRAEEARVVRNVFAGRVAAERAERIARLAASWDADVLVHDEVDFGAAVAARRLGLPHVPVIVCAAGGFVTSTLVGEGLVSNGLVSYGQLGEAESLLTGDLVVAPVMPSFRDPAWPLPREHCAVRPAILSGAPTTTATHIASWLATHVGPLVYVTLGTIFPQESGNLFARILEALAQIPVKAVMTVGREVAPAELGRVPDNVLVEAFVPDRELIPNSRLVITHAGSGTVMSALACGVPVLALPMGADQPWSADRCVALGVGRALDAASATAADIASAATALLSAPGYAQRAGLLAREAADLPSAQLAADRIAALVAKTRA